MFYKDSLATLLAHHHPSTGPLRLAKPDLIQRVIQANAGLPTMDQWLNIYDQRRGDDRDESKAERHSRLADREAKGEDGDGERRSGS